MQKELVIYGVRYTIPDCEENEVFRLLERYIINYGEGYLISNYGRVYSLKQRKILQTYDNDKGYQFVILSSDNLRKNYYVHTLVARAFLPNPEGKPHVHHKDVNPKNNHADNLMWVTPAEHGKLHREINEIRKGVKSDEYKPA